VLVGVSILFIIARGIEFGDLKTQKWLTSILTSFFSSVFLTQPSKVHENLMNSIACKASSLLDYLFGLILCFFHSDDG
jgi:hypothetical protein